jgi:hypothetical protein
MGVTDIASRYEVTDEEPYEQSQWLWTATAVGLAVSAVISLVYAIVERTPTPVVDGLGATGAVLERTGFVVGLAVVLLAFALVVVGAQRRGQGAIRRFASSLSPALVALGIGGLVMLHVDPVAVVFADARIEQSTIDTGQADRAARVAWWCACLSVLSLSVVAARCHIPRGIRTVPTGAERTRRRSLLAVVLVVILSGWILFGATLDRSPFDVTTASGVEVAPFPDSVSRFAYEVQGRVTAVAGAGYVSEFDGGATGRSGLEAFGGDGKPTWSLSDDELSFYSTDSTGTGPGSVVYADVSTPKLVGLPMIGVDAMTGEMLWAKWGLTRIRSPKAVGRSLNVIMLPQRFDRPVAGVSQSGTRWLALAPRSGEVMWAREVPGSCEHEVYVSDTAVVLPTCPADAASFATVVDPETGRQLRELTAADHAGATGKLLGASGGVALIEVSSRQPYSSAQIVVELATGKAVHHFTDGEKLSLLDGNSVLVQKRSGRSSYTQAIYDIGRRQLIPLDLVTEWPAEDTVEPYGWIALDSSWVGMGAEPSDPQLTERSWRINASGEHSALPGTCSRAQGDGKGVWRLPGAVVVNCSEGAVAFR